MASCLLLDAFSLMVSGQQPQAPPGACDLPRSASQKERPYFRTCLVRPPAEREADYERDVCRRKASAAPQKEPTPLPTQLNATTCLVRSLLRNEITFRVLMNEQNAVVGSDARIAVKAHPRLVHVGARRHVFLIAAVKRVTPRPRHIHAVVITGVSMNGRHESGGYLDQHRVVAGVAVSPKEHHLDGRSGTKLLPVHLVGRHHHSGL